MFALHATMNRCIFLSFERALYILIVSRFTTSPEQTKKAPSAFKVFTGVSTNPEGSTERKDKKENKEERREINVCWSWLTSLGTQKGGSYLLFN